jgi:hypothetical protein
MRLGNLVAVAGCALVLLGALVNPASAVDSSPGYPLVVVSPGRDALVLSRTVTVQVRARSRLHSISALLNGRKVVLHKRQGLFVVKLSRSRLHVGANHFAARAIGAGGRRFRAYSDLIRAGRRVALGRLRVPGGVPLTPTVRLRDRTAFFRAYLNGRRIDALFGPPSLSGARVASLSVSDGLHFGRNRLVVRAYRSDGHYWATSRTVRVSHLRPLAGAGHDTLARLTRTVHLDGRGSRAASAGDQLRYRWRFVRRPRGSKARLRHAGAARPSFRPDVRGVYRVRLTVTEVSRHRRRAHAAVGRAASDTLTVAAAPITPPIGMPLEITGATPNQSEILVGTTTAPPVTKCMSPTCFPVVEGYTVVVLNRSTDVGGTLEVVDNQNFGPGQESQLANYLSSNDPTIDSPGNIVILISSGGFTTQDPTDLQNTITGIGGSQIPTSSAGGGFSDIASAAVIGIPGTGSGQAYQAQLPISGPGSSEPFPTISGTLTRDSTSQSALESSYTFAPEDYLPFNLNADTGQMTLGCTPQSHMCEHLENIPAAPGFEVAVLDAYTLQPVTNTQAFGPLNNQPNAAATTTQLADMASFLQNYSNDPSKLVLILSYGGPAPNNPAWSQVAQQIQLLGGDINAFNTYNLPNGANGPADYGMIGGAGLVTPAPSGFAAPASIAQSTSGGTDFAKMDMTGVLTRSNNWQYYPTSVAPLGVFSTELMPIAYENPRGWPLATPSYNRVQAYIAGLFCSEPSPTRCPPVPHDIRSQYWKSDQPWTPLAIPLQALHYPTQVVTITGNPSGGFFTLTWNGKTTHNIPYNAPANLVQYALYKLNPESSLANVRVEGGPGSGLPAHYFVDMTAAGEGTLTASGAQLQPQGGVTVTNCTSSNPDCAGFTRAEYNTMRTEFTATEWPAVDRVGELMDDLWSPFGSTSTGNYVDIQGISGSIEAAVNPPANNTTSKALATVQDILGIISSAVGFAALDRPGHGHSVRAPSSVPHQNQTSPVPTAVGATAGVLSGAFGIASIWTADSGGNKVLGKIQTSAQNLSAQAASAVEDSQLGLERLRELLVSDYGKLTTTANFANAEIPWSSQQQSAAVTSLITSTRQNAYNALIPIAYPGLFCTPGKQLPTNVSTFNQVTGSAAPLAASRPPTTGTGVTRKRTS